MAALTAVLFWIAVPAATVIITTLLGTLLTRFRLWPSGDDTRKWLY
ncbi:hypothetical protein SAMN05192561_12812 [Halopenitus malekzadehii]|jgi:hypothetical protein|uniref:Uncharacterized protein n=1 Tax=Halopenitus malekzadehii TaxID=1267564 RepID=A0A1H6K4S8_9EURY|nr:hypothetical protein [Halopenitus malekzadehii]SEH67384.1 hypothetical protein SAMN05192561_12812 [Halopenitus malekzadehii]